MQNVEKLENIREDQDTPVSLDTDARNRRLLDTLLAQGLWATPVLNDYGFVISLQVSVSNPN